MFTPVKPDIQTIEQRMDATPNFNSLCFELFRQWTAKVKEESPEWEPEVENEQEILKDIREAYVKAIDYAFEDPGHFEMMEYSYFYYVANAVTGHVQGGLSVTWNLRYRPLNKEYRNMLWMKSITQYFATFPEAAREVIGLFTAYHQSGFPFKNEAKELTQDNFSYYSAIGDLQFEQNNLEMLGLLYLNMTEYGIKFRNKTKEVEIPSALDIFGAPNVTFLLTGEWYKATMNGPFDEDGYTFEWVE